MKIMQIVLCSALYLVVASASAEIYKWVDEDGKVHYGDKPVENASEVSVDTSKKGHMNPGAARQDMQRRLVDAYDEDRQKKNEEQDKSRKQKKKLQAQCTRARDKLRRIMQASSLYDLDKDGNRVTLSKEQRLSSTQSLREHIRKNCN